MGLMMLVIVLFSAFFIAFEMSHDCEEEDCPICAVMQQCENNLRMIAGGASSAASSFIPVFIILFSAAFFAAALPLETLVKRKVRLND